MARNMEDTGKHLIRMIRQGGQAANAMTDIFLEGRDDIIQHARQGMKSGASQAQVIAMVQGDMTNLKAMSQQQLTEDGLKAAQYQAQSSTAYLAVLGVEGAPEYRVTKKFVKEAFKTPMLAQNVTVDDLLTGQMANMSRHIVNATRQAYATGETVPSQAKFMRAASGELDDAVLKRKANALARTAIAQVSNSARQAALGASEDVKGYIYVATLDHRTSNVCKVLDGQYWAKDSPALRRPPLHVSCRSTLAPVLKGEKPSGVKDQLSRPAVEPKSVNALEEKGLKTRNNRVRKPSSTDRSPLKAVVKSKYVTYEQWIKTQPVAYQREILGPKAYGKFKQSGSLREALGVAE